MLVTRLPQKMASPNRPSSHLELQSGYSHTLTIPPLPRSFPCRLRSEAQSSRIYLSHLRQLRYPEGILWAEIRSLLQLFPQWVVKRLDHRWGCRRRDLHLLLPDGRYIEKDSRAL